MAKLPKKTVVDVPKNLDEAAKFLAQIGQAQRTVDEIENTLNEEVEKLKATAMANAKPHQQRVLQLIEGLFVFAQANRDQLTDNGKRKTVEMPTGIFGWRMTPPAVKLRDIESVLAGLKALKLERFIRTKEEVDKEAILKEPELAQTVNGVSIGQREEFIAKPAELKIEIATQVDKLKKSVA